MRPLPGRRERVPAYDQALAAGWPIATRVIKGACRHLIGDRLDITGARGGLDGAEAVLTLRAVISNGDFDEYWRFHLTRQHQRLYPAQRKASTHSAPDPLTQRAAPSGCHPGRRGPGRARRRTLRPHSMTASRGADSR